MDCRDFETRFKKSAEELSFAYEKQMLSGVVCKACFDSGFTWLNVEGFPAWAYCKCDKGKLTHASSKFNLPLVDYEMLKLFSTKDFPLAAFVPSALDDRHAVTQALDIVKRFQKSLRESEQFWKTFKG